MSAAFPLADLALAQRLERAEGLMAALPGSGSQRNAESNGFRIAYTRIKWKR